MLNIITIALPFFGLILLGVVAARFWAVNEDGLAWLNIFVVYFALPALIFSVVAATPLEQLVNPAFVAATGGVTVFCFLLMTFSARHFFRTDLKTAALQGTAASYGNVGYMGLPLAVAFFGPEAAVPAALIFCFDCTVEFVLTAVCVGLGDTRKESKWPLTRRIAKDVLQHPFIISTALGIAASAIAFKPAGGLQAMLEMLMRAAGPVALFAMGVTVALRKFHSVGRELPLLVFIKVVLQPVLACLVVMWIANPDAVWLQVAVVMAALPTASNAFVLARQYGTYIEGAGAAVIVTTLLSVLTIPVLVYVLRYLLAAS